MDVELLSRIQFGFTASFHYIYPPISIGLGLILVLMEGTYLRTGNRLYHDMARFWVKVFALVFGMGVATGIVLEFQFGTNWSAYSRYVGDVFGSVLAAEGIFAFFLESGFLAILVFGWDRVSKGWHFFATCMVSLGSIFSAVWILIANSWMQTPAGFHIVGHGLTERAEITDFWAVVFNPSAVETIMHTVMGAFITGSMLVVSVSAYYLLKKRHLDFAKASMKIGLTMAVIACVMQLPLGHKSAIGVASHQPLKLAAMKGHYDSSQPMDLVFFGWVDEANQRVIGPSLPGMGSWLVHQDTSRPMTGLDSAVPRDRPPVQPVFQAYSIMVGVGMALIGITVLSAFMMWRGTLWNHALMLKVLVVSVVLPQIANQTGWFATEVGRQPWVVYNLMRTEDAISPVVTAGQVMASLVMFTFLYILLFALFIYLLDRMIKSGPMGSEPSLSLAHGAELEGKGAQP